MSSLSVWLDVLAAPPALFALAFALFFAARRWSFFGSRAGGLALAMLTASSLAAGLYHDDLRHLILEPRRLPVTVLLLASAVVLWVSLERPARPAPGASPASAAPAPGFSPADAVAMTLMGLVLAALVVLHEPALAGPADPASPPEPAKAPWFLVGLQEMRLYFDPWMAEAALPLLFVAGLLALPHLGSVASPEEDHAPAVRRAALNFFLFGWLLLWLLPIFVATFFRGPGWLAYGPFEAWDAGTPAPPPPPTLSEAFWTRWAPWTGPESPWLRELPGILLLGAYFVLLPWVLPRWRATRGLFGIYRKALGSWRFSAAMLLGLALLLVPLKMYGRWLVNIGYWIHLPEISWSF